LPARKTCRACLLVNPTNCHLVFANLQRLDNTDVIYSTFAHQNHTRSVLAVKKTNGGPIHYIERFGSLTRAVAAGRLARQRDGRIPGNYVFDGARAAGRGAAKQWMAKVIAD
jgi:hypothetical protein